jgi:hypothetical protein
VLETVDNTKVLGHVFERTELLKNAFISSFSPLSGQHHGDTANLRTGMKSIGSSLVILSWVFSNLDLRIIFWLL